MILLIFLVVNVFSSSIDFPADKQFCCRYASAVDNCHDSCLQIFKTNDPIYLSKLRTHFPTNCPKKSPDLIEFWNCLRPRLNETDNKKTFGSCCELALSDACRNACIEGKGFGNLTGECRETSEEEFYNCLFKQKTKQKCCRESGEVGNLCLHQCKLAFHSKIGPTKKEIEHMALSCGGRMGECLENYTRELKAKSVENSRCCELSSDIQCRESCRKIFRVKVEESAIVTHLIDACGDVRPHEAMWKCFLKQSEPISRSRPIENNLQCCFRAKSSKCQQLCTKVYGNPWSDQVLWSQYQRTCADVSQERRLQQCLKEVSEPCRIGCSAMTFCDAFNNRPTTLFRQCTKEADFSAKHHFDAWSRGAINLPHVTIPVKNISQCEPKKWKAAACLLQIKPCNLKNGAGIICKSDCINLLKKCVITDLYHKEINVEELCDSFSPSFMQNECISLSTYVDVRKTTENTIYDVTQPCHPNPCENNQVCVIERQSCDKRQEGCRLFTCHQGCKLYRESEVITKVGSLIRKPDLRRGEGCFQSCRCLRSGHLGRCRNLPCFDPTNCFLHGENKNHGERFYIDCNFCTCFSGKIVCTKRNCLKTQDQQCICPNYDKRKCNATSNSCVHDNDCVAECLHNISGNLLSNKKKPPKNPCSPNPCRYNERCVPTRRTCLASTSNCLQFDCLPPYRECLRLLRSSTFRHKKINSYYKRRAFKLQARFFSDDFPSLNLPFVCDTDGLEHDNICKLARNKRKIFSYFGKCKVNCGSADRNRVCGYDKRTYTNRCQAKDDLVLVDHDGPCRNGRNFRSRCENVTCITDKTCNKIHPSGSCCPVCATMLRILLHQKLLKTISQSIPSESITTRDIILLLQQQVQILECQIYGHLSGEDDLIVFVISKKSTSLSQREACRKEAEKLYLLINERSPGFVSQLLLSPLIGARLLYNDNGATKLYSIFYVDLILLLITLALMLWDF